MRRLRSSSLIPLDLEIEKTAKANRRKAKESRNRSSTMGDANVPPRRLRVKDYIMPSFDGIHSSIARPAIAANNFHVDSATMQAIRDNKFNGLSAEDPNAHLRNFLEIVDNFKVNGVPEETIRLRLFSRSLDGRAREWLDSLPNNSITTWNQLVEKFLNKYFSPAKTKRLIKEIQNFQQFDMESLYEAYERFKDLLRKCPHHGLSDQQKIRTFYNGLTIQCATQVDGAARGSLTNQYPEDAFEILEDITSNNCRAYDRSSSKKVAGVHEVDPLTSFSAQVVSQFEALNKKLESLSVDRQQPVQSAHQVQNIHVFCDMCGEGHPTQQCPLIYHDVAQSSSVNYVGNSSNQQNNPFSNTYNPGWRNHPNFSWNNNVRPNMPFKQNVPPGFQQNPRPQEMEKKPNTEDLLLQYMQKTDALIQSQSASMRALQMQVGQLASAINNRPSGSLPSNTEPNPKNDKREHCKAITLRSGKEIEGNTKKVDDDGDPEKVLNEEPSVLSNPKADASTPKKHVYPPPPFPQRLQKQKQDKQFQKFMDVFKKLSINIPFAEALEQMPSYVKFMKDILSRKRRLEEFETVALTEECSAILQKKLPPKLKDPGSFTIPCTIGNQYFGKALCDLGASVNLMPLSIFVKLGVGEVKPTSVRLQLADRSLAYPRGVVEDVLVKVDKFIFPADFIVLDMEEDADIPLLLGRPFLATGRTLIDVQKGELTMRVQDE